MAHGRVGAQRSGRGLGDIGEEVVAPVVHGSRVRPIMPALLAAYAAAWGRPAVVMPRMLYGGYGYMAEQPVARAWRDARVTKILAGSNEIMKELVGRDLGL
jgi:alkylation response protein AidB-like acyl-CoA dehydrogenase